MQHEIEQVLEKLNRLIQSDGSSLNLVEAKGDTLTLRFDKGAMANCEQCVIDEDALEMLVREAILSHLPAVKTVKITTS